MLSGRCNNHSLGLATKPTQSALNEVIQHKLCFCINYFRRRGDVIEYCCLSFGAVILGIVFLFLFNAVIIRITGIAKQRIQYKPLLNCLLHGIFIKIAFTDFGTGSEKLHGLFFRCGGKSKITYVSCVTDSAGGLDKLVLSIFHILIYRIQISCILKRHTRQGL